MGRKDFGGTYIGYDLGNQYSQISFCRSGDSEPETASAVTGTEQYNIPTILSKKKGSNQWFYGKEALKYAGQEEENGVLVENIFVLAMTGEEITVDDESFDPIALLTLFIKRSLSLLAIEVKPSAIDTIMFTVDDLKERTIEVLKIVAVRMQIAPEQFFIQSRRESIYWYVMHQQAELRRHQILVFEYEVRLQVYYLKSNKKTTPMVMFVEKEEYSDLPATVGTAAQEKAELDLRFLKLAEKICSSNKVSAVYLLGEGFRGDWAENSIKFLCQGRRVFRGNNMYSKGACYSALEKRKSNALQAEQIFLGEDSLKSNIGMKVLRRGAESYFAVLNAGCNWYEAQNRFEVILDGGTRLFFIVTSLTDGLITEHIMDLDGIPDRPARTTRLLIDIHMESDDQVRITVSDMGFGELFPATDKEWTCKLTV